MDQERREKIAVFRFGVIFPLVERDLREHWGEKERILRELASKEWEIPFSDRRTISRATIVSWLGRYEGGGRNGRGCLTPGGEPSMATIHRLLRVYEVENKRGEEDMRKLEVQMSNDRFRSDSIHGPLLVDGKKRKSYLGTPPNYAKLNIVGEGIHRFPSPHNEQAARQISAEQFEMLLDGIDFFRAHRRIEYSGVS